MFRSIGEFGWCRGINWRGSFQAVRDSCNVGSKKIQTRGIAGAGSVEVVEGFVARAESYAKRIAALKFDILAELLADDICEGVPPLIKEG